MGIVDRAIAGMKELFGEDRRRTEHALKVLAFAREIADGESYEGELREKIELAAVLHDIGIHEAERKHGSSAGRYQELEGPAIAKKLLESIGAPGEITDRVCYIVGGHHTPSKNNGPDFQTIWEADLLVNIEEEGLINRDGLEGVIQKNFKTRTGMAIAVDLYLKR